MVATDTYMRLNGTKLYLKLDDYLDAYGNVELDEEDEEDGN